jgi:putative intracellular protease/amidase
MRRLVLASAVWLLGAVAAQARPLVVILGDPGGAEVTDLLAPYAILAESGAVDVKVVSADDRTIPLMPGVAFVRPQLTLDGLAKAYPKGPDVIVVPALMKPHDPERAAWLNAQVRRGARIVGICEGVRVLAHAGLLKGRQATGHWYRLDGLRRAYPDTRWRRDVRWVTDGQVTSTAGVTASVPASLALLRDLAGEETMLATASRLGLQPPDVRHAGADFRLTRKAMMTAAGNLGQVWAREDVAVPLSPGFDELAVGLTLDGWSLTWRSTAWAVAAGPVVSRRGLTFTPAARLPGFERTVAPAAGAEAMFGEVAHAYGEPTARFVALQLEHPYGRTSAW